MKALLTASLSLVLASGCNDQKITVESAPKAIGLSAAIHTGILDDERQPCDIFSADDLAAAGYRVVKTHAGEKTSCSYDLADNEPRVVFHLPKSRHLAVEAACHLIDVGGHPRKDAIDTRRPVEGLSRNAVACYGLMSHHILVELPNFKIGAVQFVDMAGERDLQFPSAQQLDVVRRYLRRLTAHP